MSKKKKKAEPVDNGPVLECKEAHNKMWTWSTHFGVPPRESILETVHNPRAMGHVSYDELSGSTVRISLSGGMHHFASGTDVSPDAAEEFANKIIEFAGKLREAMAAKKKGTKP
ncbi:unnamed protein product [marine sediment metagenome]|uniref:Uncharacterized protein n=1 Tax=marine sediment metagenome TaxID=412755 RepID=X0SA37_9ZZZZ